MVRPLQPRDQSRDIALLSSSRLEPQLLDYLLEFPLATWNEVCYNVDGPGKKPVRSRQNPVRCGILPVVSAPHSFLRVVSDVLSNDNVVNKVHKGLRRERKNK